MPSKEEKKLLASWRQPEQKLGIRFQRVKRRLATVGELVLEAYSLAEEDDEGPIGGDKGDAVNAEQEKRALTCLLERLGDAAPERALQNDGEYAARRVREERLVKMALDELVAAARQLKTNRKEAKGLLATPNQSNCAYVRLISNGEFERVICRYLDAMLKAASNGKIRCIIRSARGEALDAVITYENLSGVELRYGLSIQTHVSLNGTAADVAWHIQRNPFEYDGFVLWSDGPLIKTFFCSVYDLATAAVESLGEESLPEFVCRRASSSWAMAGGAAGPTGAAAGGHDGAAGSSAAVQQAASSPRTRTRGGATAAKSGGGTALLGLVEAEEEAGDDDEEEAARAAPKKPKTAAAELTDEELLAQLTPEELAQLGGDRPTGKSRRLVAAGQAWDAMLKGFRWQREQDEAAAARGVGGSGGAAGARGDDEEAEEAEEEEEAEEAGGAANRKILTQFPLSRFDQHFVNVKTHYFDWSRLAEYAVAKIEAGDTQRLAPLRVGKTPVHGLGAGVRDAVEGYEAELRNAGVQQVSVRPSEGGRAGTINKIPLQEARRQEPAAEAQATWFEQTDEDAGRRLTALSVGDVGEASEESD